MVKEALPPAKLGSIRNGALRTNQGPSQDLNEPEPAATKGTRDAQQAPSLAEPNEREPCVESQRPEPRHCRTNPRRAPGLTPLPRTNPSRASIQTNPSLTMMRLARCSASGCPAAATDSYGPMDHPNKRLTANG
jgi:hypothetical protein